MKNLKIKILKCRHYKGDGYTYDIGDNQEINLCDQCEMLLLSEMKKQEVIENKTQLIKLITDFIKNDKKL